MCKRMDSRRSKETNQEEEEEGEGKGKGKGKGEGKGEEEEEQPASEASEGGYKRQTICTKC